MSRTLAANELSAFLSNQRRQIAAAFTEIEQVQVEYQGAYTRFKTDHDKTLRALAEQIETQANGTGRALKPLIEARIPQEQQSILQQIADFEEQSAQLQAGADELLALNQKAIADLRETNPKLNEREETSGRCGPAATSLSRFKHINQQQGFGFVRMRQDPGARSRAPSSSRTAAAAGGGVEKGAAGLERPEHEGGYKRSRLASAVASEDGTAQPGAAAARLSGAEHGD
jgi:hypothetical protein